MTLIREPYSSPQRVKINVVATPLADLVVAMWAGIAEKDSLDSFENHATIEAIRLAANVPTEDAAWMGTGGGMRWSFLLQFIVPNNLQTIAALAGLLEEMDAEEMIRGLTCDEHEECADESCHGHKLEVGEPGDEQARLVGILRAMPAEVEVELKALTASLEHDQHLTKFLARRLDPEPLIETVTNGIAFRIDGGIEEIVLIPSLMIRPWNLMFGFEKAQYFVYSASDEAVNADPNTPPSWMVGMFKSLGDERRLRLLRRLGDGPAGLGELAEVVDLAKSTTHHHLRLLRAAGLVKAVITGPGKDGTHYELRPNALPDAAQFVADYLGTGPIEGEST